VRVVQPVDEVLEGEDLAICRTVSSKPALPVAGAGIPGPNRLPAAPRARLGRACMLVSTDSGAGVRGFGAQRRSEVASTCPLFQPIRFASTHDSIRS
jgi:hypothetical protein